MVSNLALVVLVVLGVVGTVSVVAIVYGRKFKSRVSRRDGIVFDIACENNGLPRDRLESWEQRTLSGIAAKLQCIPQNTGDVVLAVFRCGPNRHVTLYRWKNGDFTELSCDRELIPALPECGFDFGLLYDAWDPAQATKHTELRQKLLHAVAGDEDNLVLLMMFSSGEASSRDVATLIRKHHTTVWRWYQGELEKLRNSDALMEVAQSSFCISHGRTTGDSAKTLSTR